MMADTRKLSIRLAQGITLLCHAEVDRAASVCVTCPESDMLDKTAKRWREKVNAMLQEVIQMEKRI